jgi:hypothetical protein
VISFIKIMNMVFVFAYDDMSINFANINTNPKRFVIINRFVCLPNHFTIVIYWLYITYTSNLWLLWVTLTITCYGYKLWGKEHTCLTHCFSGIHVARSLVFCIMFCWWLFVLLLMAIVLYWFLITPLVSSHLSFSLWPVC